MTKPTIVILGANGNIGEHVIKAVLSNTFRNSYTLPIRVVTRDAEKAASKVPDLKKDLKFFSADISSGKGLAEAFDGVDVVVNLLGVGVPQKKVADAAAAAKVKIYIPSEFGCNLTNIGEFTDFAKVKIDELKYAQSLKLKTVVIAVGAFSEWAYSLGPFLGLNYPETGDLTYYGDIDTKICVTSVVDIGKTVASIATKKPSEIPEEVLIAGDVISPRTLKEIYEKVSGKKLKLIAQPLEEATVPALKVVKNGPQNEGDFLVGLRGIIATGGFYHKPTGNDFVSKGLFKFSSFEEVGNSLYSKNKK